MFIVLKSIGMSTLQTIKLKRTYPVECKLSLISMIARQVSSRMSIRNPSQAGVTFVNLDGSSLTGAKMASMASIRPLRLIFRMLIGFDIYAQISELKM